VRYNRKLIKFDSIYGRVRFYAYIPIKVGDYVNEIKTIQKEIDKLEKFIKPTANKIDKLKDKLYELQRKVNAEKLRKKYEGKFFKYTNKRDKFERYVKILSISDDGWYGTINVLKVVFEDGKPLITIDEWSSTHLIREKQMTKKEFDEAFKRAIKILK